MAGNATSPIIDQVSIAHSSATGPGRPLVAARIARRLVGRADAGGEFREVAQQAELVGDLVQMAVALVDGEGRDLADQGEDGRIEAECGQQGGRGVQQARAGHHRERLRPAGGESGAERHVGGGLLVAGVDDADAPVGAVQRVEQVVVMHAGQAIQRVDAVQQQAFDHRVSRAHARHPNSFSAAGRLLDLPAPQPYTGANRPPNR
jgi:hypothetical protein